MASFTFDELAESARDPTTFNRQRAPHERTADLDDGPDDGLDGFTLESYMDELSTPRLISFSWRYFLRSFTTKADTPFRKW